MQCTKGNPSLPTQIVYASRTRYPSDSPDLFLTPCIDPCISSRDRIDEINGRTDFRGMAFVLGVINIPNAPRLIDINLVVNKNNNYEQVRQEMPDNCLVVVWAINQDIVGDGKSSDFLETAGSIDPFVTP